MIDFHSHILPDFDDGARDAEEALEMLAELRRQGADTVVATPHYRGEYSVERFLRRRKRKYDMLLSAMEERGGDYPRILLGAEVAVGEYLIDLEDIEKLCIEGTDYLLVEMPNRFWEPFLYHVLYSLTAKNHVKLVIAHVDRYYTSMGRNEKIMKLIDMQPVFQINTPVLNIRRGKKLFKWLLTFGAEFVLGTDSHNMQGRSPEFAKPVKYITKKYGAELMEDINLFGNNMIN